MKIQIFKLFNYDKIILSIFMLLLHIVIAYSQPGYIIFDCDGINNNLIARENLEKTMNNICPVFEENISGKHWRYRKVYITLQIDDNPSNDIGMSMQSKYSSTKFVTKKKIPSGLYNLRLNGTFTIIEERTFQLRTNKIRTGQFCQSEIDYWSKLVDSDAVIKLKGDFTKYHNVSADYMPIEIKPNEEITIKVSLDSSLNLSYKIF